MNPLSITVVLVILMGVRAQLGRLHPMCDSPEAEEAALVAQDYLNAHHTHGYKYALNRIEDIKIAVMPDGNKTYYLEIDLLETDCHVVDPTPVANCTVRPKISTAVQGDCDVVLRSVGGALTVTAFKCRTEESTEDLCLACPVLLPLNDTAALDFIHSSLVTFNNVTVNTTFALFEVGRVSTQMLLTGAVLNAEYVIIEENCTNDVCVPLNGLVALRGVCIAKGTEHDHIVDCKIFSTTMTVPGVDNTAGGLPHAGTLSRKHGLRHHKLTAYHDPHLSGLVSAESAESLEVVPIVPAAGVPAAPAAEPAVLAGTSAVPVVDLAGANDPGSTSVSNSAETPLVVVKREVPAPAVDPIVVNPVLPVCPGRIRFF